jgi:O-antigen/teichoic acid export membrane protein
VLSYGLLIQLCCLTIAFFLLVPFKTFFSAALFPTDPQIADFWTKAVFIIPGHILLNYSLNILLWQRNRSNYILLCFTQAILTIVAIYFAVVIFDGGINELFYALVVSHSICGLLGLFLVGRHIIAPIMPVNTALLKKLLLFGLPFSLTAFFQQLLPAVDRYFLLFYKLDQELPQYILAVKLGSFVNLGVSAFVMAFTPYSMNKLNEEDGEKDISELFRLVSISAFCLVPIILIFKDVLVNLFASSDYALAATLLPFFFMAWVFDLLTYFSILGAYKSQNSFIVLAMFIIGTVVICVLNLVLVPSIGVYGAALSFCITKMLLFMIPLYSLRKHFKITVEWGSFLTAFVVAVLYSFLIYNIGFYFYIFLASLLAFLGGWYLFRQLQKSTNPVLFGLK